MKGKTPTAALPVLILMCILGVVVICVAPMLGQVAGDREMESRDGDITPERYNWIINIATMTYRLSGIVISLIGGLGFAGNWTATYKSVR